MNRREFLAHSAGAAGALTAACSGPTPAPTEERPNIILLMGDDHAWDEVGYNGHPHLHTPVLDEMAASGLRMDRFYSAHPSCSPTRGSVLTGRHPNRYGTFTPNFSIRPEEITIAHILRDEGYSCGHFGKWHVGPVKAGSPTNPGAMGFDEWLSHDNFFELNPWFSRNGGPPEQFEGESSEIVIDEAIQFIEKSRESGKPFFTVVWYGSPHEPYSGLDEDLALYDDLPEEYAERTVRLTSNETGMPVERPLRDVLRERYAEITAMDRSIGTLRRYLADEGLRDNTIVWYCGDNGIPTSGRATTPFRGQKGQVYEGGVRVPGGHRVAGAHPRAARQQGECGDERHAADAVRDRRRSPARPPLGRRQPDVNDRRGHGRATAADPFLGVRCRPHHRGLGAVHRADPSRGHNTPRQADGRHRHAEFPQRPPPG